VIFPVCLSACLSVGPFVFLAHDVTATRDTMSKVRWRIDDDDLRRRRLCFVVVVVVVGCAVLVDVVVVDHALVSTNESGASDYKDNTGGLHSF
jgi:hypothetical protein